MALATVRVGRVVPLPRGETVRVGRSVSTAVACRRRSTKLKLSVRSTVAFAFGDIPSQSSVKQRWLSTGITSNADQT